jgi:hypothetical protein
VVDLAPTAGGLALDGTFAPLTGIPSEPSALAVLQGESGMQVLVTAAGGDRVFAFSILEPLGTPVLPEASTGPLVQVTPLPGEPLTVVATLTAGTGTAGGVTALSTGVGGEAVDESSVELLIPGLSGLGAVSPAWALGLLTRLPGGTASVDPAGEAVMEGGPKPVAAAEKPRPIEDGLDLEQQLRGLDLYQPTPSPDRPVPISGRPGERRGQELIARTSATNIETLLADLVVPLEKGEQPQWWAGLAEVAEAMVADLESAPKQSAESDAVLLQPPSAWNRESWRWLELAGLALWPWPGCSSPSDGEAQRKQERQRGDGTASATPRGSKRR